MKEAEIVQALRNRRSQLIAELRKVESALKAFGNSAAAEGKVFTKVFTKSFPATCTGCGVSFNRRKSFKPGRQVFHSEPCRMAWWTKEHKKQAEALKKRQEQEKLKHQKGTVLIPGDQLRAGGR